MAAESGTPVGSEPIVTVDEHATSCERSNGCVQACTALNGSIGVGGDLRLCCRPWAATTDVHVRITADATRLVYQAVTIVAFAIIAWFLNSSILVFSALISFSGAIRDGMYLNNSMNSADERARASGSLSVVGWIAVVLRMLGAVAAVASMVLINIAVSSRSIDHAEGALLMFWLSTGFMAVSAIVMSQVFGVVAKSIASTLVQAPASAV